MIRIKEGEGICHKKGPLLHLEMELAGLTLSSIGLADWLRLQLDWRTRSVFYRISELASAKISCSLLSNWFGALLQLQLASRLPPDPIGLEA